MDAHMEYTEESVKRRRLELQETQLKNQESEILSTDT